MRKQTFNQGLLHDLLNNSDQIYYLVLDENQLITEANKHFNAQLSILGKSIIGRSFSEMIFPLDFSNYQYLLEKTLSDQKSTFKIDLRKLCDEGEDFIWTSWEFKITSSAKNRKIIGIGHSISKRRSNRLEVPKTMNELQVKNEVLDGLFEDRLLGFWLWDMSKKKDQLSTSLFSLLGYDLNDIEARNQQVKWKKHVFPSDLTKVESQLKDHFTSMGKIPFHSEFRILSLKDEIKYVVCYGKVVNWTQSGDPSLMVGGLFDISEKKKSEALIEKQDKFLQELTFNQSHLMRAKLANILGVLEVIDVKEDSQEAGQLIEMIKEEATKLDKVLQESIHTSSALNSKKSDSLSD